MPTPRKIFHSRQSAAAITTSWIRRLKRTSSSSLFSIFCIIFGLVGCIFGWIGISNSRISGLNCRQFEPMSVSVAWENRELSGNLVSDLARPRRKVLGFVGIQTGFGSAGRRRSLRKTWFPSDREGLLRSVFRILAPYFVQNFSFLF